MFTPLSPSTSARDCLRHKSSRNSKKNTARRNRICRCFGTQKKLIIIHSWYEAEALVEMERTILDKNAFMTLFLHFSSINFTLVFTHPELSSCALISKCGVLRLCNKSVLCMSNNLLGALWCEKLLNKPTVRYLQAFY